MDMWKFYAITHKNHLICNPMNKDKFEMLCSLLKLKQGARVLDIACGKGEFLIRLTELYDITGIGVTIAIIDTGVDHTHDDLVDNYIGGYDSVNDDNDPMDDNGHGTHCAGIAVGKGNESGYQYIGVAPDTNYYAFKAWENMLDIYLE